jgi:2-polyprenyl-6-methoxyphenol hydroxylase-like FAD-dependent oxidoreductase
MQTPVVKQPMPLGQHALVIGGSLAGLLVGRVLADHFERVTIVERDPAPDSPTPRQGVPQGQHIHALLVGGSSVIARLFPGFFKDLVPQGSTVLDFSTNDVRWFHHGVWKVPANKPIRMYAQTRPFLEWHVRRRMGTQARVAFRQACEVTGLLTAADRGRVTGVRLRSDGEGEAEAVIADLVVDASGRGSASPRWLAALGYQPPEEMTIGIHLAYASRLYQPPPEIRRDWKAIVINPKAPEGTKYGLIFPIEGERWMVTLAGVLHDAPPGDDAGFLEFARRLDRPEVYESIAHARPLGPVAVYKFPTYRRRQYERLRHFPDGLLVVGDAICSFNPIYGQGMSVCALEADLLDRCLSAAPRQGSQLPADLSRRFFKGAATIVDNPWGMATGADFLYPQTEGRRPLGSSVLSWYNAQLLEVSAWNATVATRFYEVMHFLRPPTALFHPYVLFQALKRGVGLKGSGHEIRRQSD